MLVYEHMLLVIVLQGELIDVLQPRVVEEVQCCSKSEQHDDE